MTSILSQVLLKLFNQKQNVERKQELKEHKERVTFNEKKYQEMVSSSEYQKQLKMKHQEEKRYSVFM